MATTIIGQDTRLLALYDGELIPELSSYVTGVRFQFELNTAKQEVLGESAVLYAVSYSGCTGTVSGVQRSTALDHRVARILRDIRNRTLDVQYDLMSVVAPPGGREGYWLFPDILWNQLSSDTPGKSDFRTYEHGFVVQGDAEFVDS